ncbi:T-cell leukemia translocation-altered gene protein [Vombatus ursinus]|uniref:T cell leukemia translocation altered n=1 Tax=Vombatus ursinus TaxID=29139 RepID=A0A4X2LS96_VOMUR|nr:T-cell leukemia translocation-altered gene protein [Vombatus ursinus]
MLSDIPTLQKTRRLRSSRCSNRPGARWVSVKLISMAAELGSELGWQALPTAVLGGLSTLGSEFLREWEAQDMRVTLFKLLLLWLVLSLLGIQLAWGVYGSTVTGLYHRPSSGLGGQNGSTPDGSSLFPPWETSENEAIKTHRE